jgi:hypothetical protein
MYQLGRYLAFNVHQIRYRAAIRGIQSQLTHLRERGLTQMLLDYLSCQ